MISSCPNIIAFNIISSDTSLAPASTILIASLVPATFKSTVERSICSTVGLITYSPSTYPTVTPAIGPLNGIFDTDSESELPSIAAITGSQSYSTDNTVEITCTSFLNPSSNNGLIGLSIKRAARVASVPGRPSLRKNPPGIFPTAYIFSS